MQGILQLCSQRFTIPTDRSSKIQPLTPNSFIRCSEAVSEKVARYSHKARTMQREKHTNLTGIQQLFATQSLTVSIHSRQTNMISHAVHQHLCTSNITPHYLERAGQVQTSKQQHHHHHDRRAHPPQSAPKTPQSSVSKVLAVEQQQAANNSSR